MAKKIKINNDGIVRLQELIFVDDQGNDAFLLSVKNGELFIEPIEGNVAKSADDNGGEDRPADPRP